jgi:hypothetical protein
MVGELRRAFNANYSPERYQRFVDAMRARAGEAIEFRLAETPCFFRRTDVEDWAEAARELILQLTGNAAYLEAARAAIPPEHRTPGETERPLFVQVDFGLVREPDGTVTPRLVEIQGFPSLYAYQLAVAEQYIESYALDSGLGIVVDAGAPAEFAARLRRAILGAHDPENVVLLEIEPERQKTRPDFRLTGELCGIHTVCLTRVEREGRRLSYRHGGRRIPIRRIYNRVILDELERKDLSPPFHFHEDLDVEWAGHPNWYYLISKFSLPYLRHPAAPRTVFLDQVETLPRDLDNYVLKPLYSFAGRGVKVGVTPADIAEIPPAARRHYVLQERLAFTPVIETPHGPTQAELRFMFLWDEQWFAGPLLVRMGRGKMMGVDHNRDLEWVGASAGLVLG